MTSFGPDGFTSGAFPEGAVEIRVRGGLRGLVGVSAALVGPRTTIAALIIPAFVLGDIAWAYPTRPHELRALRAERPE